jgi:hypothetical protein
MGGYFGLSYFIDVAKRTDFDTFFIILFAIVILLSQFCI